MGIANIRKAQEVEIERCKADIKIKMQKARTSVKWEGTMGYHNK